MTDLDQQQVLFGHNRYRVDRFWGKLPEGLELGIVSTLAVASDGALFVAQRNGPPVLVFEPDGTLRQSWPDDLAVDPHGINIVRGGLDGAGDQVLLVDRDAHQVLICTLDGRLIRAIGERHRPNFQAPFNHPTSAFGTSDGEIYVADGYGNSTVHRFGADGTHVSTWGSPGNGPGEFTTPHSVWVDARNRVLVADRENSRIQVFGRDGEYLDSWTGFYKPMDIAEDNDGMLYISDQIPRVSQIDADGHLCGRARPAWNVPHGLACGVNGEMFVIEMNPSSLTRLTPIRN